MTMRSRQSETLRLFILAAFIAALAFSAASSSQTTQTSARIDFRRDVLPIFRQNCIGCHGPSQQINGLRLDHRSPRSKNGLRRVVPGSSENSFLDGVDAGFSSHRGQLNIQRANSLALAVMAGRLA